MEEKWLKFLFHFAEMDANNFGFYILSLLVSRKYCNREGYFFEVFALNIRLNPL